MSLKNTSHSALEKAYTRPSPPSEKEQRIFKTKAIREWRKSRIANDLIKENLRFSFGDDYLSVFLEPSTIKRANTGIASDTILKRWDYLIQGFWYSRNFDILDMMESDYHQIKPFDPKKKGWKGKTLKYVVPSGKPCKPIFPLVPDKRWKAIAQKYGVAITKKDTYFWQWVLNHPEIPITVTEGLKKTLSLLSQNLVAIGLTGIWNFRREKKYLYEELKVFCDRKRQFNIAFDEDEKLKTRRAVSKATFTICSLLQKEKSKSFILSWHNLEGKGIDDVLFTGGDCRSEVLEEIFKQKESFNLWASKHLFKLSRADVIFSNRWVSDSIQQLPPNRLIAIRSCQNTGKTQIIAHHVQECLKDGIPCFILVHLESLAKALSKRFGVNYRTESDATKGYYGYSLCVDSCWRKSNGLNPDDWEEPIIVIDEIEQVVSHLLNGETAIADNRPTILTTLVELIEKSSQVIIADADLSDVSVNLFENLLDEKAYIFRNDYQFDGMEFFRYQHPENLFFLMSEKLNDDEKGILFTTSQKAKSKYSTIALERYIRKEYPTKRVLRIDSETIQNPEHSAYKCLSKINELLINYDVVIISPSLQTGVSIDIHEYFDFVIGFSMGNITPNSFLQQLWRLRDLTAPRYYYTRTTGNNYIGNGSSSPQELLSSTQKVAKYAISELGTLDCELHLDDIKSIFLETWAKLGARQNASNRCYAELLERLIIEQGHTHITLDDDQDSELKKEVRANSENARNERYERILNAYDLIEEEKERLELRRQNQGLTQYELDKLDKHRVNRMYSTIDTDILTFDDETGNYSKLRLFYYLTIGDCFLKCRDNEKISEMATSNNGNILSFDVQKKAYIPKVKALKKINILDTINELQGREFYNDDQSILNLVKTIKRSKKDLSIIGIRVSKYDIATANSALSLIGFKIVKISDGGKDAIVKVNGISKRVYKLEMLPDFVPKILGNWHEKDCQKMNVENCYDLDTIRITTVTNFLYIYKENYNQEENVIAPPTIWERAAAVIEKYIYQPLENIWNALEQELKTFPDDVAELIADEVMKEVA